MGRFCVLPPNSVVKTPEDVERMLLDIENHWSPAIDTETTGTDRTKDYAVLISISTGSNRYTIFPQVFDLVKPYIEHPLRKWRFWNAPFDIAMLRNIGINIDRHTAHDVYHAHDGMVMHHLEDDTKPHSLKFAAKQILGIEMKEFMDVFGDQIRAGRSNEEIFLDPANEEMVTMYAGLDAYTTYWCTAHLIRSLKSAEIPGPYKTLWEYYEENQLPLIRVLYEAEKIGIKIDTHVLQSMGPEFDKKLAVLDKWFVKETGNPAFNVSSTKHLSEHLFGRLGYKPVKLTPGGAPSTDVTTLTVYAGNGCEFSKKVLEYRHIEKQLGTYVIGLLKLATKEGRIHTSFKMSVARTGRLSSSNPNLQNQILDIRLAYVADEGMVLTAWDYDQLEMRVTAHFSGDPKMAEAIATGKDLHTFTAAMMFGVPYDEIMTARAREEEVAEAKRKGREYTPLTERELHCLFCRKSAKAINFGLLYGMGPSKLARTLGIPVDEAKKLIKLYFKTFPGVEEHFRREIARAKKEGAVYTILGRRRRLPRVWSRFSGDVAQAERQVKNTPIQGSAADIVACAMIQLYESKIIRKYGARIVLQVHDEIVLLVPEAAEKSKEFNDEIRRIMENPLPKEVKFRVKLTTSGKYGENWKQCK